MCTLEKELIIRRHESVGIRSPYTPLSLWPFSAKRLRDRQKRIKLTKKFGQMTPCSAPSFSLHNIDKSYNRNRIRPHTTVAKVFGKKGVRHAKILSKRPKREGHAN